MFGISLNWTNKYRFAVSVISDNTVGIMHLRVHRDKRLRHFAGFCHPHANMLGKAKARLHSSPPHSMTEPKNLQRASHRASTDGFNASMSTATSTPPHPERTNRASRNWPTGHARPGGTGRTKCKLLGWITAAQYNCMSHRCRYAAKATDAAGFHRSPRPPDE